MTGFEPLTSGVEATGLPTEPHNHCLSENLFLFKWPDTKIRLGGCPIGASTCSLKRSDGH